eukprot:Tbor_TRINITY_DN3367_c0_g1::TRINITY_DN3367_c0_g1_i1::g.23476::m.23476/K06942/ychF; ribosome-binding ATPase
MIRLSICLLRGAGIVGLPNVGKSTLFNAMTCSQQAKTGNYPFCTIDANLAKVDVYDERLRTLAAFAGSKTIVDVEIDLADVAGLIAGASKGAGLGNKFLNDIRPCSIIFHMVRCFESPKDGFDAPDPLEGIEIIQQELILSDLEAMEKRWTKVKSKKAGDPEVLFAKRVLDWLEEGKPARLIGTDKHKLTAAEEEYIKQYQLLSAKPMMYVLNVDDANLKDGNKFSKVVEDKYGLDSTCRICSVIEEQTSQFSREERIDFLKEYGIDTPATEILLQKGYRMLNLQSFFTVGPKMSHGWSIVNGTTAKKAAGEIHGDFDKYFKSAKVSPWNYFSNKEKFSTLALAENNAMMKVDHKYIMNDGDVFIVEHDAPRK